MERDLNGASFVFVGGSGGIASAAVLEIARRGARILIVARRPEKARGLLEADRAGATRTEQGLEWVYALQFLARAKLNVALADLLEASGDGRVVHIGAKVPAWHRIDWEDLQFNRRWSLFPALMNSQKLGYLHVQEAQRRWRNTAVSFTIACVGPTGTPAIESEALWIRLLYRLIATTPEKSSKNAVMLLTTAHIEPYRGAVLFDPKTSAASKLTYEQSEADRAWGLLE